VVALRNGTMGWNLAGLACDSGKNRRVLNVSGDSLAWAQSRAADVARRLDIAHIDSETLARFRGDRERTLYVFDVRDPPEYAAGHFPGAVSAPGGQLVQATDQYVGTLGARVVLVDDKEVRAAMTASWLRQMGWADVFVLVESGTEKDAPKAEILGADSMPHLRIDCAELAGMLVREAATIVDLSLSRNYLKAHIPGAWFAIRSRLPKSLATIPARGTIVLTSEDGLLARIAAPEVSALTSLPVRYLGGGNAAWRDAGQPLTAGDPHMADEPVDAWLKPYERPGNTESAMAEYLAWETDLLPRIDRDGTAKFSAFHASPRT
jgi:3-mercaptopyruvate sulfurtransferase SseA